MVLIRLKNRLIHTVRDSDTVGRYGGGEFVVLLHEIKSEDDAIFVTKEIIQAILEEYRIDTITAHIGCSIGITIYKNDNLTVQEYINQADEAMYEIKKSGKNHYKVG